MRLTIHIVLFQPWSDGFKILRRTSICQSLIQGTLKTFNSGGLFKFNPSQYALSFITSVLENLSFTSDPDTLRMFLIMFEKSILHDPSENWIFECSEIYNPE